jgi:hypothetical protein
LSPYITPGVQLLPTELLSSSSQKKEKENPTTHKLPKDSVKELLDKSNFPQKTKTPTTTKTNQGFCQELLDKSKLRRSKKTKIQQ